MQHYSIRQLIAIVLGFMICTSLQAQIREKIHTEDGKPQKNYPIHGSDLLWKQELQVQKFVEQHPLALRHKALHKTNGWGFTVGSKKSWYADNLVTFDRYRDPSTCRAVGNNCYIFVEDTSWNKGRVTQATADSICAYFDSKTPANPSKGVYQMNTEAFGNPPNVDDDQKIIILLLDIKDGYDGAAVMLLDTSIHLMK